MDRDAGRSIGLGGRARRTAVAMLLATGLPGGLLASTSAAAAGSGFDDCENPPVTMRLESVEPPAGAADFEVTHGLARRVPILTGRDEPGQTPKELDQLEQEAAKTKLAMYQIFLADFRIPRTDVNSQFSGAFPTVEPKAGKTFATLSIIPTKARGFKVGDVVTFDDELGYDTFTTFATIGLGIETAEGMTGSGVPAGEVEVLAVDKDEICVAVDFELTDDGALVAGIEGVVAVPVVKAPKSIYFF